VELGQKSSDQTNGGVFIGEDPDHAFPSSDLFIQSLLGVRASESDTILPGKGQNRERFFKAFVETIHRLGRLLQKGVQDLVLEDSGFFFGIGPEQPGEGQCQRPSLGGRRMTRNVPEKMDLASLPADSLKMSLNRFFQPFVVIGDHQVHPTQSPALEITQHVVPGGLVFAVSQGESQDLPLSFFLDSGRNQCGHRNHAIVLSDRDHQGIQQEERIRTIQTTVSPMVDPGRKAGRQGTHRGLRKLGATQLFRDVRDLTGRDSLDHHLHQRQDQGLFRALVASEQIRRKISVPGLGNPKDQRSHPCRQLSFPVSVPVTRPIARALMTIRPKMIDHLGFQNLVQYRFDQLFHSFAIIGQKFGKRSGFSVTLMSAIVPPC